MKLKAAQKQKSQQATVKIIWTNIINSTLYSRYVLVKSSLLKVFDKNLERLNLKSVTRTTHIIRVTTSKHLCCYCSQTALYFLQIPKHNLSTNLIYETIIFSYKMSYSKKTENWIPFIATRVNPKTNTSTLRTSELAHSPC